MMRTTPIGISLALSLAATSAYGIARTASPDPRTPSQPQVAKPDLSRYQVIFDRKPFGPPVTEPGPRPVVEPAPPMEPFTKFYRMCGITKCPDGTYVGLVRTAQPGKPGPPAETQDQLMYYLKVGETSADGITLVEANYEKECALLRKGNEQHWIFMSGALGTGDAATAGPGPLRAAVNPTTPAPMTSAVVDAGTVVLSPTPPPSPGDTYADRLKWRQEMRRKKNVELASAATNQSRLTGEAMEKRLREYNLRVIREGVAPPLPIPLTKEEDDQLVKEGVLPPRQ